MINKVFNEDCLVAMQRISSASIDLILCDLPYGTTQNKWDSVIPMDELWQQYNRITKPNGAIVLTAQTPFDKALGASNLKMLKYEWIWQKNKATGHLNSKKMPLKEHENILVFYKNLPTYNPQGLVKLEEPVIRKGKDNGTNYGKSDKDALRYFTNYPRDVLKFDSVANTVHPTEKPVALFEYLIRTYTNPGDTVLDNCAGSGTTGEACINTGRNYILMELNKGYYDGIVKRLALVCPPMLQKVTP